MVSLKKLRLVEEDLIENTECFCMLVAIHQNVESSKIPKTAPLNDISWFPNQIFSRIYKTYFSRQATDRKPSKCGTPFEWIFVNLAARIRALTMRELQNKFSVSSFLDKSPIKVSPKTFQHVVINSIENSSFSYLAGKSEKSEVSKQSEFVFSWYQDSSFSVSTSFIFSHRGPNHRLPQSPRQTFVYKFLLILLLALENWQHKDSENSIKVVFFPIFTPIVLRNYGLGDFHQDLQQNFTPLEERWTKSFFWCISSILGVLRFQKCL